MQRQIKELELEMRGRHRRRDNNHGSSSSHTRGSSRQSRSCLSRDRSNKYWKDCSRLLRRERRRRPNATLNAMSMALWRVGCSPFTEEINHTKMPRHFTWPPFTCYGGKIDPLEHVSHYIQLMPFIHGTMDLCAKCSRPVSVPRPWDGSTVWGNGLSIISVS